MLKLLRIKNFAIMEDLQIAFDAGLTVITGETGAGKSMIAEAIAALCGDRMDDLLIRTGRDYAEITGAFDVSRPALGYIERSGIAAEKELIIRRRIERGKRQSSYINDQLVSLGLLRDLAGVLVDLVGQYENQSLFYPQQHLLLLDKYAGLDALKEDYGKNYSAYKDLESRLAALIEADRQKDERIDYLRFQINELERAGLQENEEEQLHNEKNLLSSSEKRAGLTGDIVSVLYEDEGSVLEKLYGVKRNLDELKGLDAAVGDLAARMDDAIAQLDDIYREVNNYKEKIDYSKERLDYVLERLETITGLKKKYGKTIHEMNGFLENLRKELAMIETRDEEIASLKKSIGELGTKIEKQAEDLSGQRREASSSLKRHIIDLLGRLGMEKAQFEVQIEAKEIEVDGKDRLEFYLSTNPGEALKPLRKIASGGEISRLTLSLKTVMNEADDIPAIVFDEVDTGIGGRMAEAVGELLAAVSKRHQVICITHLPQITKFADNHILVEKEIRNNETFTRVRKLDDEMRKMELARMLSGKEITKKTIDHAAEILQKRRRR
jgi:DNA repair protein RecN (Recombination protein N)